MLNVSENLNKKNQAFTLGSHVIHPDGQPLVIEEIVEISKVFKHSSSVVSVPQVEVSIHGFLDTPMRVVNQLVLDWHKLGLSPQQWYQVINNRTSTSGHVP